jgi:hypothetical protein
MKRLVLMLLVILWAVPARAGEECGFAAHNATTASQEENTVMQAETTEGVATRYGADTASSGVAIEDILKA